MTETKKLRIVLVADKRWIHTINWANGLYDDGHEVHLISMQQGVDKLKSGVIFHKLPFRHPFGYMTNVFHLRKLVKQISPDIINTHYASGYGTLTMLSGCKPNVLSVWGSDVYEFPEKSGIHKSLIKRNLKKAEAVFSTSKTMANRVKDFLGYKEKIFVTPFGIDLEKFSPFEQKEKKDRIVLGTVKKLESKYGIDVLLEVFRSILDKMENDPLKDKLEFLIVGGGSQEEMLKIRANQLGLQEKITFTGHIPHEEVPKRLNSLDVYYALSTSDSETFGVAVLEASACALPVMVSTRGGLWEVVQPEETGYILEAEDVDEISSISLELIRDESKRVRMGKAGRSFVEKKYSWDATLKCMVDSYMEVLNKKK